MISFDHIANALRYPGAYIEIDPSKAGLSTQLAKVLLVGQKLAGGSAAGGTIIPLSGGKANYDALFGRGSMLSQMAQAYKKGDVALDVYALPLLDNPAGVEATGTITATTAATANGTLYLYIAAQAVSVGITSTMTTAQIATAIAAAINAKLDLPCTATATTNVATLTARHKGITGNHIDVRLNLYQEVTPTGLALSISGFSGGAGNPALPTLSSTLGTTQYHYLALGFADAATLAAVNTEAQRRFQPPVQAGFRAFCCGRGDAVTVTAFTDPLNYEHISYLPLGINPTPTWEGAAAYAAACAPKLRNNPAESLEGRKIEGMIATTYYDWPEANSMLFKGCSIMEISSDGSCYIKRPITMYQNLSDGTEDDAYLDINTVELIERIRYEQRTRGHRTFRGSASAKTPEGFRPGLRITTVDGVRAFLLSLYKNTLQNEFGWVQNYEAYKASLVVEQDPTDPTRFNYNDQPTLLSPYYVLAGRMSFLKR